MSRTDAVGVRELRQNLSVYLRRVKQGEALDVTENGRIVARLIPARRDESVVERLMTEGKITPATASLDDLIPPKGPITAGGTRALREQRRDRI
jgi:prevent-host-death family protein